jgi:hypothetical protein
MSLNNLIAKRLFTSQFTRVGKHYYSKRYDNLYEKTAITCGIGSFPFYFYWAVEDEKSRVKNFDPICYPLLAIPVSFYSFLTGVIAHHYY